MPFEKVSIVITASQLFLDFNVYFWTCMAAFTLLMVYILNILQLIYV